MPCPDPFSELLRQIAKLKRQIGTALLQVAGLRARLALSRRWRQRVALAVGIGAVLVSRTAEHTPPVVALVAPVVDVHTGDGRANAETFTASASQIPPERLAPKSWQRAPCRPGELRINGMCFAELKETPNAKGECRNGLRHEAMCLIPITAKDAPPASMTH